MIRMRRAFLVVGLLVAAIVVPPATFVGGASGEIKLALMPVGQAGSFFDLTLSPGASRSLQVDVANHGDASLAVRTYASDVYTIINGGFGGRLRDTPRSGMTTWLDYGDEVIDLPAGKSVRRRFTVSAPADAAPGEYIAGLVLENDQPIPDAAAVGLNQVIRQAVAIVVTVPGARAPALGVGAATHKVVAGRSTVSIAVQNTGNVRLKPVVEFTLFDADRSQISHATLQMDTFYARTDTFVEMPLAALLAPGRYTVHLTLGDEASGAGADAASIPLVIEATPGAVDSGAAPGLIDVIEGAGGSHLWLALVVAGLTLAALLAVALAFVINRWRRHRNLRTGS
jgi:hypothetical protein